jgi:hypothetical protein
MFLSQAVHVLEPLQLGIAPSDVSDERSASSQGLARRTPHQWQSLTAKLGNQASGAAGCLQQVGIR